jgi:hypothetical protein
MGFVDINRHIILFKNNEISVSIGKLSGESSYVVFSCQKNFKDILGYGAIEWDLSDTKMTDILTAASTGTNKKLVRSFLVELRLLIREHYV